MSFLREKYKPHGGPDGGDGGNGGSAYICGDPSLNTLMSFKFHSTIYVERGVHGKGKNKRGANGSDTVVKVPVGTMVWRVNKGGSRELLADVIDTQLTLVARGGRGGWGNSRYVSATNQEPMLAERGETGQWATLLLELKMLADVGIIARPNAGKSTLLTRCSQASPRVADYPFTTVEPVLGVVAAAGKRFIMMEIPGLLSGAHRGVGLGHQFLRHAERAPVYLHLIDGSSEDPVADFYMLNEELKLFNPGLLSKPQLVAVNKLDIPEVRQKQRDLEVDLSLGINQVLPPSEAGSNIPVFFISAATGEGVPNMLAKIAHLLDNLPKQETSLPAQHENIPVRTRRPNSHCSIQVKGGVYVVTSEELERLAALADVRDYRVRLQLWKVMNQLGVARQLEEAGIQVGDTIRIGKVEMEWS